MKSNGRKISITLEYADSILNQIYADEIKEDITIGRSEDNMWRLPASDIGAHRHHAVLKRQRNGTLILSDCESRESIYYMGSPVKEHRLKIGDMCSIGDSKLIVREIGEEKKAGLLAYHQLEQLTGGQKGKVYRIINKEFKIGSAADSDCQIRDSLVSKLHAIIEQQSDGSCVIKDNGSRNGTMVNGIPLRENEAIGRMLKDGDIISIAYVELKFWDKNVVHVRSHLVIKLCAVIATLAVALGGYFGFQTFLPNSKALRLRAEQYAAKENFAQARQILQEAREARGADIDRAQRNELERKLTMWEETADDWRKVMDGISKGDESSSFILLCAKVAANDSECWNWTGTDSLEMMRHAQETNGLLVYTRSCEEALSVSVPDEKYLREILGKLDESIKKCADEPLPFRAKLLERAYDARKELANTLETLASLQKLLVGYSDIAQTEDIVNKVKRLSNECDEHLSARAKSGRPASKLVQRKCATYLEPLVMLQRSHEQLLGNYEALARFDFAAFNPHLSLPGNDSCSVVLTFPSRRADLENANANLARIKRQLENFCKWFDREFPLGKSAIIDELFSDETMKAVLAFDCLESKMPSYSAKEPSSVYDKILGIYVFFDYLSSLDIDFDTTVFEERFKPNLFKVADLFRDLEIFHSFFHPSAKSLLYEQIKILIETTPQKNKILEMSALVEDILKKRDDYVRKHYGIFKNEGKTRRGIVAGGIACSLMTRRHVFIEGKLNELVFAAFKELRRELNVIAAGAKGDVTPEKVLEVEKKLLEQGIPGDPLLKQPWTDRVH